MDFYGTPCIYVSPFRAILFVLSERNARTFLEEEGGGRILSRVPRSVKSEGLCAFTSRKRRVINCN